MMKFEYDRDADAAYLYLEYPLKDAQVKKTVSVTDDIIVDFDEKGKMLGVEILNASKVLKKKSLIEAEQMV